MPPRKPATMKAAATKSTTAKSQTSATSTALTTRSTRSGTAASNNPVPCKKKRGSKETPVSDDEDDEVEVPKPRRKSKRRRIEQPGEAGSSEEEDIEDVDGEAPSVPEEEVNEEDDDLEARHRAEIEDEKETKDDASRDIFLIFSPWTQVRFKQNNTSALLRGRWCHLCSHSELLA
ncbi:hypothetical protein H0H81_000474 [Sphagnurus paluster]|uniref:Uncharacterized protein n=1 Tax=Sphagnurus paluster TaxID=117069 RepID=A0A9P7FRD6_9AGAR|nr:hypothetical protein H0H81_000474 [Sphagnurus paluster]